MTCAFCGRQATHEIRKSPCCERCWTKLQHILEDEEDYIPGMWCDDMQGKQELMYEGVDGKRHRKDW